jgi:hypothetical protein
MLVVSRSYQNYQYDSVSNHLIDGGRGGIEYVGGDSESDGV